MKSHTSQYLIPKYRIAVMSFGVAACLCVGNRSISSAAGIASAGSQLNVGESWRTTTFAKTLDLDNDSVYGTAGYAAFSTTPVGTTGGGGTKTDLVSLPSFVDSSSFTIDSNRAGGFTYAAIDNPTLTPGSTVANVESGTITGGTANKVSFKFTGVVPARVRLGIMVDNLDGTGFNATSFSVSSSIAGSSGSITEPAGNQVPDWYFVDITGAAASEVITINVVQGSSSTATLSALSFDIPEPAAGCSVGIAGVLSLFRRRRNAARSVAGFRVFEP